MTFLYNEGAHAADWVEGYTLSGGTLTKNIDHLYAEAVESPGPAERAWVTDAPVDLTGIDEIVVDWEGITSADFQRNASFIVSTTKIADEDTFDARIQKGALFARTIDTLDVSALTGSYYVRVHARFDGSSGPGTTAVAMYAAQTIDPIVSLAASSAGSSTASGSLLVTRGLAAQSDSTGAVTASLSTTRALMAAPAGASTATAALSVTQALSAAIASSSAASATLSTTRSLAAVSTGASTVAADLSVDTPAVDLSAAIMATSTVSAGMTLSRALVAASSASSTSSASLFVIRRFTAAPVSQSTITSVLTITVLLAALIDTDSLVSATLTGGSKYAIVPPGVAHTTPPPQPGHARFR